MNRNLRSLILGMAAFAATPALADAIFFEHENFSGRQYASGQSAADFRDNLCQAVLVDDDVGPQRA